MVEVGAQMKVIGGQQNDRPYNLVVMSAPLPTKGLAALSLFSVAYFAVFILLAFRKLIWDDEFFSLYIARSGSYAEIMRALMTGADQHPPLFYWITQVFFQLFGVSHVSLRL